MVISVTALILASALIPLGSAGAIEGSQNVVVSELVAPAQDSSNRLHPEPIGDDGPAAPSDEVSEQPAGPPPTPRHTGVKAMIKDLGDDFLHLPSKENLFWAGLGGGLALAVHPADSDVTHAMVNSDFAHDFFKFGSYLGEIYTLLPATVAVYVVGRAKDLPKVSHVGMDLLQSLAVSEAIVNVLKFSTQRERPDGSNKLSFPSGHAADTFAVATALERHLGWKGAVPAYIFASYVAMSRLPDNRHWLSDVVFGASVGIIAGRTVTRHGPDFPVAVTSVPGGFAILYVRRERERVH
jgi:membrane-associated phospholipid phosphatase